MRGGHLFEEYKGLLSFEIMYAQKWGYKNDMYADFMWKQEKCMIYRKVKTNLSRTLSSIEQDKATSDDYVKCILADPQIAAYIVQALVPEFKEMEAEK